jgi:hypothetical protein
MNLIKYFVFLLFAALAAAECFRGGPRFAGRRARIQAAKAAVTFCKRVEGRDIPSRRPVGICRETGTRTRRSHVNILLAQGGSESKPAPNDCVRRLLRATLKCQRGGGSRDMDGFVFM